MKKYLYKEKDYFSLYQLRKEYPNLIFPKNPSEELFSILGIQVIEYEPEVTPEQELAQAKYERAEAVSKITVEVDGMKFDGDETAQTRMGRTISAAMALSVDLNTEKRTWVLADNTIAEPTIAQLAQALKLAGDEQTRLWTVPYQSDSEDVSEPALAKIGV